MCGINGIIQYNYILNQKELHSKLERMNEVVFYRGPDDSGIYTSEKAALGMVRLSIIDLSKGHQPIYNEDRTKIIVFNGEIYNYKSLRNNLLKRNHVFSTDTDTEVALHAYEEYGRDCPNYLNGMFCFAVYDIISGETFIARDRVGEKPLYYINNKDQFVFASELKSILSTGIVTKKICKEALSQYLQLTYIPAPLTIFEDIFKLLPAHYILINKEGGIQIEKYWDVKYDSHDLISDYDECKKELRQTLYNAVENSMISDVPIGAFLSGGIDSSTIVGIMSDISAVPINTFTIGFKNKEFDESGLANITAKRYKTNHSIFTLDYDAAFEDLNTIINNLDEPFADSSAIPTYFISKFARKSVKVVLTGDAGDELFGGYSKYLINYYTGRYKNIPSFLRNSFENLIYVLPDKSTLSRKIRKVIESANKEIFDQRKDLMCLGFKHSELNQLFKPAFMLSNNLDFIQKYYKFYEGATDELSQTLYTDLHIVLEGDMLLKVDRMSMLNSIEARVPFLDKNVIELAARIPSNYKIHKNKLKMILKDTFNDIIPKESLRGSKKGFEIPLDIWFRGPLKNKLLNVLNENVIKEQGIFNHQYIETILDEHFTGKKNRKSELWTLFIFQKWYQNYFIN